MEPSAPLPNDPTGPSGERIAGSDALQASLAQRQIPDATIEALKHNLGNVFTALNAAHVLGQFDDYRAQVLKTREFGSELSTAETGWVAALVVLASSFDVNPEAAKKASFAVAPIVVGGLIDEKKIKEEHKNNACDAYLRLINLQASGQCTNGQDCGYLSIASLAGGTAVSVAKSLNQKPWHYSAYPNLGLDGWVTGEHFRTLGLKAERLGQVFMQPSPDGPQPATHKVGYYTPFPDCLDSAVADMSKQADGTRFHVRTSRHLFHAVKAGDEIIFLESQSRDGRTMRIPDVVLRGAADTIGFLEITKVTKLDGAAPLTPTYVAVDPQTFLRASPWAWIQGKNAVKLDSPVGE